MNLLYTITAYPPSTGGAQLHHHLLALHLKDRHSIRVVSHWDHDRTDWLLGTTLNAPSEARQYEVEGIPVHRLGLSRAEKLRIAPHVLGYYPLMDFALPGISATFERHLRQYAAEADLVHNVRTGREGLSYASFQAARARDIPFVFTPVHHPRWTGWRYRAFLRLYQMADLVIALTHAEKETLVGFGVPRDRIVVTGIGPVLAPRANPARFLQDHGVDGPVVLFVGRHYPYKGFRQLLQAIPDVWQRVPEAHFVFIGPPVDNSERDFERVPDRRIHRLGTVDLQTKTDALAACDLLCVPSTQESFGGVYTEAWSFGRPVIGCNIPAVREVIEEGQDGYLVDQDPGMIAERIAHLLLHPADAQAMGAAGRRKVQERYTWERLAQRTEQAYGDVTGSKRAR